MYHVLFYKTIDDYIEKRMPYRDEHLKLVRITAETGDLIMAGAFTDPADSAMLIFKTADRKCIEDFVNNDPYVTHGLIQEWYIRPWIVMIEK